MKTSILKTIPRTTIITILTLIFTSILTGCLSTPTKQITAITYNFYDSSVPPPYHRSYEIIVTKEAVTLTVDSYGEILVEKSFPQTEATLASFTDFIKRNRLKKGIFIKNDSGCTGGTGEKISVTYSDGTQFKGVVYYCGRETTGDLRGDIETAVKEIRELIPNLGQYLK